MPSDIYRIGGALGFMVDSAAGVPQLLGAGVDAIILDYLAEGAMGLLGRARQADANAGHAPTFMSTHVGPHLERVAAQGTRIVANAGGVNPAGLAAKLRAELARRGLPLTVGCVSGDDLLARLPEFVGTPDMDNGRQFPANGVHSLNAYLGAFPIAAALDRGADIVITGRVVDSALTLGLLIHRFGWAQGEWDLLAAGTLAGHLIECSAQATGGTFTDWDQVEDWANIGHPIAECRADGSFVLTKPEGTGGLVSPATVAEQMLYETTDPQAYIVPDVVLDFSQVTMRQAGPHRVEVAGAIGHPASATLKVCATWDDGWRGVAYQPVIGPRAVERAQKQADAIFERCAGMLRARNLPPYLATETVMIGAGAALGPRLFDQGAQEVIAKLIADHPMAEGAGLMVQEQYAAICGGAPGHTISIGAAVTPLMQLACVLVPKTQVTALLDMGQGPAPVPDAHLPGAYDPASATPLAPPLVADPQAETRQFPLGMLAWLRSGEKGETINVGVIARDPAQLGWIRAGVMAALEQGWLDHLYAGQPARFRIYDVPGIHAFNVVLSGALPGGLNTSTRLDSAAKSVAQQLVDMPIAVPV